MRARRWTAPTALAAIGLVALGWTTLAQPEGDAACTVGESYYWRHIHPRHCDTDRYRGKSKFTDALCGGPEVAERFCRRVQRDPDARRRVERDGNVRYDVDLEEVVGRRGQTCARVVIAGEDDGRIITQFPQFGGGVGDCGRDE